MTNKDLIEKLEKKPGQWRMSSLAFIVVSVGLNIAGEPLYALIPALVALGCCAVADILEALKARDT